jgi:hypothetical protein
MKQDSKVTCYQVCFLILRRMLVLPLLLCLGIPSKAIIDFQQAELDSQYIYKRQLQDHLPQAGKLDHDVEVITSNIMTKCAPFMQTFNNGFSLIETMTLYKNRLTDVYDYHRELAKRRQNQKRIFLFQEFANDPIELAYAYHVFNQVGGGVHYVPHGVDIAALKKATSLAVGVRSLMAAISDNTIHIPAQHRGLLRLVQQAKQALGKGYAHLVGHLIQAETKLGTPGQAAAALGDLQLVQREVTRALTPLAGSMAKLKVQPNDFSTVTFYDENEFQALNNNGQVGTVSQSFEAIAGTTQFKKNPTDKTVTTQSRRSQTLELLTKDNRLFVIANVHLNWAGNKPFLAAAPAQSYYSQLGQEINQFIGQAIPAHPQARKAIIGDCNIDWISTNGVKTGIEGNMGIVAPIQYLSGSSQVAGGGQKSVDAFITSSPLVIPMRIASMDPAPKVVPVKAVVPKPAVVAKKLIPTPQTTQPIVKVIAKLAASRPAPAPKPAVGTKKSIPVSKAIQVPVKRTAKPVVSRLAFAPKPAVVAAKKPVPALRAQPTVKAVANPAASRPSSAPKLAVVAKKPVLVPASKAVTQPAKAPVVAKAPVRIIAKPMTKNPVARIAAKVPAKRTITKSVAKKPVVRVALKTPVRKVFVKPMAKKPVARIAAKVPAKRIIKRPVAKKPTERIAGKVPVRRRP